MSIIKTIEDDLLIASSKKEEKKMKFTLEEIDLIRKRTNASYKDAKEALERAEGDIVGALAYLDEMGKAKDENYRGKNRFVERVKALIHKGNIIKLTVHDEDHKILSIPLNIVIVAAILAIHIVLIGLLIAVVLGYEITIENTEKNTKVKPGINIFKDEHNPKV